MFLLFYFRGEATVRPCYVRLTRIDKVMGSNLRKDENTSVNVTKTDERSGHTVAVDPRGEKKTHMRTVDSSEILHSPTSCVVPINSERPHDNNKNRVVIVDPAKSKRSLFNDNSTETASYHTANKKRKVHSINQCNTELKNKIFRKVHSTNQSNTEPEKYEI